MRSPEVGTDPREAVVVTPAVLRDWPLPEPGPDKESRGRTLIIGGSTTTPGAILLAAEAALRSGAGKLQVATVDSRAPAVAVALPEAMVMPLPESREGGISPSAADQLIDLADGADAILLGPGMTDPDATWALLDELVPRLDSSVVLDALCVVRLKDEPSLLHHLGGHATATPNRRELAMALGREEEAVEKDPGAAAADLARRTRAVVGAGGEESWTAAPDGRRWRDPSGGVGLGVSGSGDVFAGIVCGLCARGASPAQAAVWASFLHGRAGDRLASTIGRVGFLARELPAQIPLVLSEIEI